MDVNPAVPVDVEILCPGGKVAFPTSALSMFKCRVGFECILRLDKAKNAGIAKATTSIFNEVQAQNTPKTADNLILT